MVNQANTVFCPSCKAEMPEDMQFCGECGTKYEPPPPRICTDCKSEVPADMQFCGKCGAKYEPPLPPQPRICANCKTEVPEDMQFCGKCGVAYGQSAMPTPTSPKPPPPPVVSQPAPPPTAVRRSPPPPVRRPPQSAIFKDNEGRLLVKGRGMNVKWILFWLAAMACFTGYIFCEIWILRVILLVAAGILGAFSKFGVKFGTRVEVHEKAVVGRAYNGRFKEDFTLTYDEIKETDSGVLSLTICTTRYIEYTLYCNKLGKVQKIIDSKIR